MNTISKKINNYQAYENCKPTLCVPKTEGVEGAEPTWLNIFFSGFNVVKHGYV